MLQSDFYFSSFNFLFSSSALNESLSLAMSTNTPPYALSTNFILFLCYTKLAILNTNWNKLIYVMQYYLHLHAQKRDNVIKFLLNLTNFTSLDFFLDFGRNNLYEFGKFDATLSNGIETYLVVWFFHLVHIINLSNQLVHLRPERARNLNLLDSK